MSDVFKKDDMYYRIDYDPFPFNPRENYDHPFTFVTWLRNYCSPDGDAYDNPQEFLDTFDKTNYEIIRVHAYIHSAIHYYIAGTEHDDEWDSGFAGLMAAHKNDLQQLCENGETVHQCAMRIAKSELEEYEAYVNGSMLFVTIYDNLGNVIDTCGGYLNEEDILDENGLSNENFIGECGDGKDEFLEMIGVAEFEMKIPYKYYWFADKNREIIEEHMKNFIEEHMKKFIDNLHEEVNGESKNGN